jgi:hypothetical protein
MIVRIMNSRFLEPNNHTATSIDYNAFERTTALCIFNLWLSLLNDAETVPFKVGTVRGKVRRTRWPREQ